MSLRKSLKLADLMCGAGGTSEGASQAAAALRRRLFLTVINHWRVAVNTHKLNHPEARHLCTNVDEVNPRDLFRRGELDGLVASPECRFHSRARNGRVKAEQRRPTAWCVPRWIEAARPKWALIENVPEFEQWGPRKNGKTFLAWVAAVTSQGYRAAWRTFCCADYGAPTTRERLIIQFVRNDCGPIVWPDPTHADPEAGPLGRGILPWIETASIIQWHVKGRWLDEMPGKRQFGGLPLSPKTLARIHHGFNEYSGTGFLIPGFGDRTGQKPRTHSLRRPAPTIAAKGHMSLCEPYIVSWDHQGGRGRHSIRRPLSVITTKARHGLAEPFLVKLRGTSKAASLRKPTPTITGGGTHLALAQPFLVHTAHGGRRRPRSIAEPLPVVTGNRGDLALCEAMIVPQGGGGKLRSVKKPMPTIATDGAIALVEPYLVKYYGTAKAASIKRPLDTITTKDRFGLVCPEVRVKGKSFRVRFRWRMVNVPELAAGQSFPPSYQFTGTKTDQVKQIGNAVPPELAKALLLARISGRSDVRKFFAGRAAA